MIQRAIVLQRHGALYKLQLAFDQGIMSWLESMGENPSAFPTSITGYWLCLMADLRLALEQGTLSQFALAATENGEEELDTWSADH